MDNGPNVANAGGNVDMDMVSEPPSSRLFDVTRENNNAVIFFPSNMYFRLLLIHWRWYCIVDGDGSRTNAKKPDVTLA